MEGHKASPDLLEIRKHKEREELFIRRFEHHFLEYRPFGQLYHPLEGCYYNASGSEKKPIHSNQYNRIIERMKHFQIFDREVLEEMPYQEVSQFRIFSRHFFSRKTVKIAVVAASLSPIDDLLLGNPPSPLSHRHFEDAIRRICRKEDVFYYVGVASTSGWQEDMFSQTFQGSNWIGGILAPVEGTYWKCHFPQSELWRGLEAVFDPEMDSEKLARAKEAILNHPRLRLKGGHVFIEDLQKLDIPTYIFMQALEQILQEHDDLEFRQVAGKAILQKKRW